MRARRALLYTPGSDWKKIEKAMTLNVDCICIDMEDGVADNQKNQARLNVAKALSELDFGNSEKLVRINAIHSGLERDDLEYVLPYSPDGIVIPKVESVEQITWCINRIEATEVGDDCAAKPISILAGIESAKGILNLKEFGTIPRVKAMLFGGEDFALSIGATRTDSCIELLYARQALVTTCAAYGIDSMDIVTTHFKDIERVRREAEFGATLGFTGKQVIHPNQVVPVQAAFTPSNEAIAYAKRVIEIYKSQRQKGRAAFALDGRMIDMPILKRAQKVLDQAKAAYE